MDIKEIILGKEVYLTDPCYDISTWCQALLTNVKDGKWLVNYEYKVIDQEEGEKEVVLSLAHKDYGMDIFKNLYDKVEESCELGVDSGTLGIFDKKYYEKYHDKNKIDEVWYDRTICNYQRCVNITEGKGAWCRTTYGDGAYIAELYTKNNQVCGIKIIM